MIDQAFKKAFNKAIVGISRFSLHRERRVSYSRNIGEEKVILMKKNESREKIQDIHDIWLD